jgi:hypothetical protein
MAMMHTGRGKRAIQRGAAIYHGRCRWILPETDGYTWILPETDGYYWILLNAAGFQCMQVKME